MKIAFAAISLVSVISTSYVHADVLTQWNFNTQSTAPSTGSGSLVLVGGVTSPGYNSGTGSSDPVQPGLGLQTTSYAAQSSGDRTSGVQFNVSTVGYEDVVINYDLRHSNTSSRYEQFQYTLDGLTFTDFVGFDGNAGDTWFNNRTIDLSSISGADNNSTFGFRVVSAFAPATSSYSASRSTSSYAGGTWRFDMVTVSAVTAVPEPETYAMLLAGLGLIGSMVRRRKA